MKSQSMRFSKVQRRKKLYLSKNYQQKGSLNYISQRSRVIDTQNTWDSCDELVCTNCVETDYYLAQFCNELLYSPSSAKFHLEGVINNPEFPKDDLYLSEWEYSPPTISVPITTDTCVDCNPQEEKVMFKESQNEECFSEVFVDPDTVHSSQSGKYDKERRSIERDLINSIYELVRDEKLKSYDGSSPKTSCRVTKLIVSEMAIQRMENIKKINYGSQIERIKYKLLQSYRAFARLDHFVRDVLDVSRHSVVMAGSKVPPYRQKIRDLEKSLQIHSS